MWNLSCRTTFQNPPKLPKHSKPSNAPKPSKPSQTVKPSKHHPKLPNPPKPSKPSKHLPQQAPQGRGHSNGFLLAFKAAVCQPANTPNAPKPSKRSKRHPRAQATSQSGTPGPRPQQRLSIGFQSCRLPARKHSKRPKTIQTFQKAPQGQGHFSIRHPRAKATAISFYWLSKLPFASPQTLQTLQNPPKGTFPKPSLQTLQNPLNPLNPPNTFPNRHPRAKATSQSGTPGPRPQQWLSIGFQSCRLPARKHSNRSKTLQTFQKPPQGQGHFSIRHPKAKATAIAFYWLSKLPFASPQTLQTLQNPLNVPKGAPPKPSNPPNTVQNHPNPPKPSQPSKHLPQQAPQGQGHFSIRHPRAKATAMAFYWLSKLPFASPQTLQTLQNPPNVPKGTPGPRPLLNQAPQGKATAMAFYWLSKLPFQNPPNVLKGTPGPRPLLNQAPQGQGHSNRFLLAFKAAVCQPANTPNAPKPSKPSKRHPRAKATSQSGTPRPRPQQFPSIDFQSSPQTLQTLQRSKRHPSQTVKPSKHRPKPSKPSKHLPQQAPQGQGHFSIRHPRAKATAMAFYWLSKLPFASPQTLQTPQNPPNVPKGTPPKPSNPPNTVQNHPNPPKPSKPSKHLPQQAPQGQGHFSIRHPRAKATAIAFYWLSKLPFASPQTLQTLQNPPNVPKGTPGPRPLLNQAPQGQGHSNRFLLAFKAAVCQPANTPNAPKPSKRSKRHLSQTVKPSKHRPKPSKPSKPSKTLQTPSPTATPGPRPLLNQAPQRQGHSNRFLLAFKAAVCQPANTPNAPKPAKRSKRHPSQTVKPSKHRPKPSKPSKTL